MMQFSDDDLHDAMRLCLETLMNVIKQSEDNTVKANCAINLANILFEISDRQSKEYLALLDEGDDEDEDDL
jgi:hypothetical protein